MVAFVEVMSTDHVIDTRITFKASWMQRHLIKKMRDALEATLRILQRHSTHKSVYLVVERQQMLREVAAVLPSYACDESFQIIVPAFNSPAFTVNKIF